MPASASENMAQVDATSAWPGFTPGLREGNPS